MNVSVTSITQYSAILNATNLIWLGNFSPNSGREDDNEDYNFITWEWKETTAANWIGIEEKVVNRPQSLNYQLSNLLPNKTYQYRVTQLNNGRTTVKTGSFDTLSSTGSLVVTDTTASSIKVSFINYNSADYSRVVRFTYCKTPTDDDPKPTSYEWGSITIPPNTTDKDVSALVTGLRNDTSYDIFASVYMVTIKGGTQTLTFMERFQVTETTHIPDSAHPSVSIDSIRKRYDTSNLKIKMHTDYEGLYRFVLLISDDANGTYWHTLVLPTFETEFNATNILLLFSREAIGQTPTYTHKDNVDIKVGIIVESETEDAFLTEKGFTYPIGNAKDISTPHTGLPVGMTLYGETTAVNVTFDETPMLNYAMGDPCGVGADDIYTLANILYDKYDTLYRDYTEDDWMAFMSDNPGGRLKSKYETHHIPLSTLTAQLEAWAEDIIHSLQDARVGDPVYSEGGTLLKSMEELAQDLTYAGFWTLDADPDEQVEALYFQKLSWFIKSVV